MAPMSVQQVASEQPRLPGIPEGIPGNRRQTSNQVRVIAELLRWDVAQIRTELDNFVVRAFNRAVEPFDH